MRANGPLQLLFEERSGTIIRRIYTCPCGKGRIVEEQDYTPGHREGDAFIECDSCRQHYSIDFGTSATKWRLYHDYTSYYKRKNNTMANNDKGDIKMYLDNVFYFKKIVDALYPDEDRPAVDIQSVVDEVRENIKSLSDSDFSEVIISCFIPDLYSGMGQDSKINPHFLRCAACPL